MLSEREFIRSRFILSHPGYQHPEILSLRLRSGILVRFPRSRLTIHHASLNARIQKDQLGAMNRRFFQQIGVAAFDDPALCLFDESEQLISAIFKIFSDTGLIGFPGYQIKVKMLCLMKA